MALYSVTGFANSLIEISRGKFTAKAITFDTNKEMYLVVDPKLMYGPADYNIAFDPYFSYQYKPDFGDEASAAKLMTVQIMGSRSPSRKQQVRTSFSHSDYSRACGSNIAGFECSARACG